MSGRLRVILVVAGAAVVVAAAGLAAVRWVVLRDSAAPASLGDVLARYRDATAAGSTPAPAGVYRYATTGSESVSALGGTTHRYPPRSTITVTEAPCGMALRWDALRTRSVTWRVCAAPAGGGGQRLAGWSERHQFFGQDDATDWTCPDAAWLPAGGAGGARPYRCDGGDTVQRGTLRVVGTETLDVGGVRVRAVHVLIEQDDHGAARGGIREERWLEHRTGLPLRLRYRVRSVNDSPIGDVTFTERYDLRLLSLDPRR